MSDIDADNNFYMDKWKDCEQCTIAHSHEQLRLSDEDPAFHCAICSKCSLSDADFDCFQTLRAVSELNAGFSFCGIVNKNVQQLPGSFHWICPGCQTEPKKHVLGDSESAVSNELSEFSAIKAQLKEITDKMNARFQSLSEDMLLVKDHIKSANSFPIDFPAVAMNSPLRKRPKSMQTVQGTGPSAVLPQPGISSDSAAVLKLKYPAAENTSLFKKMCTIKRQSGVAMPDFVQSRKSDDGSINVLFKSYKDALETKKMFEEKIDKLKLPDPVHKNMKRLDVVGLDFELTKDEVMESLIDENPGLGLSLSNNDKCSAFVRTNPDLFISILDVKKCKNSDSFRVLFRATNSFIDFLGKQNIILMHTVTHKYVHAESKLCYKCHRAGHFASKCTDNDVCGKCASTSHHTNECNSPTSKCINCVRNNNPDTAHTVFSHTCPYLADLSK